MVTSSGSAPIGTNLSYTKFLFLIVPGDDDHALARIRAAGIQVARGFFNDFGTDGTRDVQPCETIQFLVAASEPPAGNGIQSARFAVQVTASYRPRLDELECDILRRVGPGVDLLSIDGAERSPRYTSAEMHGYAYRTAAQRTGGRIARNAIILPMNKSEGWWSKSALERHRYFYPHQDPGTGEHVKGHAQSAEAGIATIFRKLYHNPDGYQRPGEYDFITYFECTDEHLATFDCVRAALRDQKQNPEWSYVTEGPEWRGYRVFRW
jgi:hypothetical protein